MSEEDSEIVVVADTSSKPMGKEIVWYFTNSFALGADFCRF